MKPYMLVEGSSKSISEFERKVADALEQGYSLAGELVMHTISPGEAKMYQSLILMDEEEEDEDEDEEFEEEYEAAEED